MSQGFKQALRQHTAVICLIALCLGIFPSQTDAWGNNAQKLIVSRAVDSLPGELRPFFESNIAFLVQHVNDPLNQLDKKPNERSNHFIELDKYGKFPFEALPRNYKAAVAKYGKSKVEASG